MPPSDSQASWSRSRPVLRRRRSSMAVTDTGTTTKKVASTAAITMPPTQAGECGAEQGWRPRRWRRSAPAKPWPPAVSTTSTPTATRAQPRQRGEGSVPVREEQRQQRRDPQRRRPAPRRDPRGEPGEGQPGVHERAGHGVLVGEGVDREHRGRREDPAHRAVGAPPDEEGAGERVDQAGGRVPEQVAHRHVHAGGVVDVQRHRRGGGQHGDDGEGVGQ